MSSSGPQAYLASPDVSCREEGPGEGAILFAPDTDTVLAINATALLLWRALATPATRDDLVGRLRDACEDAPAGDVAGDVDVFLQALLPGGFIGEVLPETVP